jgi:hypothetical protein
MKSLDVNSIGIRDLVLLELRISRYRLKTEEERKATESSGSKYKPKATRWDIWRAQYEIHAVSLLKEDDMIKEEEDEGGVCI